MKYQPHILITGATDGIGLALARRYAQRGARVLLVGRRHPRDLDPTLFTPVNYCRADLAQSDALDRIGAFLRTEQVEHLDLVIHNAGIGSYGSPEQATPEDVATLLTVNLGVPLALTHELFPLIERVRGRVVFISSVVADLPAPRYAQYAASKAALDGLARALRVEWAGRVGVQIIHPGATRTGMHRKTGIPSDAMNWQRFPSAERTAAAIVQAIDHGRPETTIGLGNRLLRWAGRNLRGLVDQLVRP